jgi:hypothetical protein
MIDDCRTVCPIPYQGYCVYERCNFWDEEKQECSGECLGDFSSLDETSSTIFDNPCTIYWTEDYD